MILFPIVERELRVSARRPLTRGFRLGAAGVGIGALIFINLAAPSALGGGLGRMTFDILSGILLLFCAFAGVFLTADCLASERREGTLGLLLLTDLTKWDIVLGKLAATSAVGSYAILAMFPVMGLPLLMGGVTLADFARMNLALISTLVLSLGAGAFCSSIFVQARTAMIATFGIVGTVTGGGLLLLANALLLKGWMGSMWLLAPTPVAGWLYSHGDYYGQTQGPLALCYWISVGCGLLGGGGLFWGAGRLVTRGTEENWDRNTKGPEAGGGEVAAGSDRKLLEHSPFQWLAARQLFPGRMTRLALLLLFTAWLGTYGMLVFMSGPVQGKAITLALLFALLLHVLVKCLMIIDATQRLGGERRAGALELLMVTSLQPEEILRGHWALFRRRFLTLALGLSAMNLLLLAWITGAKGMAGLKDGGFAVAIPLLGGVALLWLDSLTVGWVGLWTGLQGLQQHRAVLVTLTRVMAIPWLGGLLFFFVLFNGVGVTGFSVIFCWLVWLVITVVTDWVALSRARSELKLEFRRLAAGDMPEEEAPGLVP